ncbi:MAG TPA: PDZ domain-containing protein [Candidatus Binataceae bacterium]|nr:PDZ domain-containing protein [Candidatus Binataceae bacterium]
MAAASPAESVSPVAAVSPAAAPSSDAPPGAATAGAEFSGADAASGEAGRLEGAGGSPPENLIASPPGSTAPPATTVEIPAASIDEPPKTTVDAPAARDSGDVARYEEAQRGADDPQQMQALRQYLSEGSLSSPIGVELREARRRLSSGEEADGLLVIDVQKGSPAFSAGLKEYHRTTHNVLTGVAIAAAMAFPPAIILIPALDYAEVGESYDMIIGVDGVRVTNFLDFEDRMRDVRPGELIYLSVVRDGRRIQLKISVPANATGITY